jgi:hypothetical protein
MANPTTNYSSGWADVIYPGNTQQERSLADNRLIQRARDYNIHDEEIKAIQAYLGAHPTQGWTPTASGPGFGTINDRFNRIAGTGNTIDQGVIHNYGGPTGIDPNGLILGKTGELSEFVIPNTGCIPLEPPTPSGIYNPVFPSEPPWDPPPTTPFPEYPVPPGYPWPNPDTNPTDNPDAYPMGPWMQWVTWAVGYSQVVWQVQNAGNINLGPAGLIWDGMPDPWKNLLLAGPVFNETTAYMPVPAGQAFTTPDTLGRASMFDAFDVTLSVLSALKNSLKIDFVVLTGDGDTVISANPGTDVNFGVTGADHADIFTVICSDIDALDLTLDQVEIGAVKQVGFQTSPGVLDWRFDAAVPNGARVVVVYQSGLPDLVTDAANTSMRGFDQFSGGPLTSFATTKTIKDTGISGAVGPDAIVIDIGNGGNVLQYTSGVPGASQWGYTAGTKTITTGTATTDLDVLYSSESDAT